MTSAGLLVVPEIDVDVPALVSASTNMAAGARVVRDRALGVVASWSVLPSVFVMTGTESVYSALNPVERVGEAYLAAVLRAVREVDVFAQAVLQLKRRRDDLVDDVAVLVADERVNAGAEAGDVPQLTGSSFVVERRVEELRHSISRLSRDFEDVQQDFADVLARIDFGADAEMPSASGAGLLLGAAPVWVAQSMRLESALSSRAMNSLRLLAGMTESEMAAWLAEHPDFVDALETGPPPADQVSAWWSGLSAGGGVVSAEQLALIAGVPSVIGNLGGVDLRSRVTANKVNVNVGIAALKREIRVLAENAGGRGAASHWQQIKELENQIKYYEVLRDEVVTFYDAGRGENVTYTGHHIVAFDHARDVIVEYSGTIDPVTGNIPGSVQNVGIYVPGTDATMTSFGGQVVRSEFFVSKGRPEGSVGMFTWKGGAFPQGIEAIDGVMAQGLGESLARFGAGIERTHSGTVTGVGYSAGGAILGSAEAAGIRLDRSLHVSSAGAGHGVTGLEDYPNTAKAPHYSMMAPGDPLQITQGAEGGNAGHGISPLTEEGFIRLETGYRVAGDPASGQIEGHDVWERNGTAMNQIRKVISGGTVEAYAVPGWRWPTWENGGSSWSTPVMEDGYEPRMIDVKGGHK